ncbi:MAG: cob(I)yrinic acid a,c-diamide adenosyltransferase [Planctomycetota bacterium]|jgi:cob(I)alamin adenosyltransferase
MVRLTRIYTRTGDDGSTALGDGTRVPKTSARIEAYGAVDELNAFLGLCGEQTVPSEMRDQLLSIQQDLFDLGADLCVPLSADESAGSESLRIGSARTARLEGWIDAVNEDLQPLESFVLPGGGMLAATLHLARTVCRRAERRVATLGDAEPLNPACVVYLNRLSDLLFVFARHAAGPNEVLWVPTRDKPPSA